MVLLPASGNGSIAVAGAHVPSTPSVSCAVFLSHTGRCSVEFSSARGGGRGRGGARSAVRRGVRRVSEWAKALGREVCSPASWRCVPRRVSAWARALRPGALSTPGGLGRYWAAQWHLARAVGKRFRGCRAKRLYLHGPVLTCSDDYGVVVMVSRPSALPNEPWRANCELRAFRLGFASPTGHWGPRSGNSTLHTRCVRVMDQC